MDLGLRDAGFRIDFASDSEALCERSHKDNFPDTEFITAPIEQLDLEVLAAHEGADLLAGGPPCPPFSKSRFYRKEKPRSLADPNATATFGGYLEVLKRVQPRTFLLENVKGLAYKVHRDALEYLIQEAESEGYHCSWQVLNAADFGVPQIRERCFVLGSKLGPVKFPAPTHANSPEADLLSADLEPWRTAGEVLASLDTEENASDEGHFAGGKHHDLLCQVPPGDNYLYFTAKRGHPEPVFGWRKRYWSFLLKLSPDLPSWTIQARRSNNMGPFHWRNRILRIEEVKRLQTFPDDWILHGTIEQRWRQLGNAVPPLLARHLGAALAEHLSGPQQGLATRTGASAATGK